jgi:NADPH-dependent 2,4-dienoyl-CoA reductase/sulfur reductase-like enzyme
VSQGPVAVVGAGPYGLAVTAHLRGAGIETAIFGDPMAYWREHMPAGMLLRSRRRSTSIAEPERKLTIGAYAEEHPLSTPITRAEFVAYGEWFQHQVAPDVDGRRVTRIERAGEGFRLTLDDGATLDAARVVVATGLEGFERRPPELGSLPGDLVSHASEHRTFDRLAGKRVAVIGAGQSALETAALARESGAEVELVSRCESISWLSGDGGGLGRRLSQAVMPPTDVGGRLTGWLAAAPDLYRALPASLQPEVFLRCTKPAGASWLRERVAGLPIATGRRVVEAAPSGGEVLLRLDDGSERRADHVLLGTGFHVDLNRCAFLPPELLAEIELVDGSPRLGRGLESSVAGLHFAGAAAAESFGPIMRFVIGTQYAAPAIAERAAGRRPRPLRLSF